MYSTITNMMSVKKVVALFFGLFFSITLLGQSDFSTAYFKVHINNKGWITSMKNTTVMPGREFSPGDKPSPVLSLYCVMPMDLWLR